MIAMITTLVNHLLHEREEQRKDEQRILYRNFELPDRQLQPTMSNLTLNTVGLYLVNSAPLSRSYQLSEAPVWVAGHNRGW